MYGSKEGECLEGTTKRERERERERFCKPFLALKFIYIMSELCGVGQRKTKCGLYDGAKPMARIKFGMSEIYDFDTTMVME